MAKLQSVRFSHSPSSKPVHFRTITDYHRRTLKVNRMLEVKPNPLVSVAVHPLEMNEMATKPSPMPFQKNLPGGCTIDMPRRTAIGRAYRFLVYYR